jgi:pilus assembly protein FimV
MMRHKLLPLLICTWLGAAQAAELGDVAPRSFVGQPLAVDIDLLALTAEEVAGLQVRLADANVYRGANVVMNPALASVRLQVERRGQKSVLHVTTTRPVDADYVHLYVQLGVPGKQDVRLATVWLQQDPNPAPPVAPAVPLASAMTSAQAEQIAAQARAARGGAGSAGGAPGREVAGKDAAGRDAAGRDGAAKEAAVKEAAAKEAAAKEAARLAAAEEAARQAVAVAAARDRSKPAPLPSMHEAESGAPGEVKAAAAARRIAGVWVSADGKPTRAPTSADAPEVPVNVAQALLPLAPLPLPKGVKRPAQTSCAPSGISAKECVALDAHNAELSGKLMELEGKMKVLQGALGGAAPAVAASAAPKGTPPVSRAPAPATGPVPSPAPAGHAAPATPAAKAPPASAMSTASASVPPAARAAVPAADAAPAASAGAAASVGAGRASASGAMSSATASLSARAEPEAHAAKASLEAGAAASAGASASSAASTAAGEGAVAPVATKQVRVLPKLKYKKEKPPEPQSDYTLPLAAGGVGLLALLGAGYLWWRKKKSGRGPLKIWQGFRQKKAAAPQAAEEPLAEPVAQ